MNNLIIDAWPVWGMVTAIMAIVYLLWPSKLIKKNEYVVFFLCSFSIIIRQKGLSFQLNGTTPGRGAPKGRNSVT